MLHVHAAYLCCLYMMHVFAICLCFLFMLHAHDACQCCMLMMHVNAVRPCCLPMLYVCPCCVSFLSTLHVYDLGHETCPCFLSMLHVLQGAVISTFFSKSNSFINFQRGSGILRQNYKKCFYIFVVCVLRILYFNVKKGTKCLFSEQNYFLSKQVIRDVKKSRILC
jgi:hypothetical protein